MKDKEMEPVKKKRHWVPNPKGAPVMGDRGLVVEEGDNAELLAINMAILQMPRIDLHDPEAVKQRMNEYFTLYMEHDRKPTVAGIAMSLGIDRRRLWEVVSGNYGSHAEMRNLPKESRDCIKSAYILLENLWEMYMNSGKINPVAGIFLGKNHYGYQDKQEMVVTPNQEVSDFNAQDLRKRYMLEEGEQGDD